MYFKKVVILHIFKYLKTVFLSIFVPVKIRKVLYITQRYVIGIHVLKCTGKMFAKGVDIVQ